MTSARVRLAASALLVLAAMPASAQARQDVLNRAKDFYASANYEEALQVLGNVPTRSGPIPSTEVAAYQVFCLLALGRNDEARGAIEAIVTADPLFHPSDGETSPRVRTFFEDVRRPLLPGIVRDTYTRARDAYDRRDLDTATSGFDEVIVLIDELGTGNSSVSDLRVIASGFRDLSKAAAAAPVAAKAEAAAPAVVATTMAAVTDVTAPPPTPVVAPPPARTAASTTYSVSDAGVLRPVPLARDLPPWSPANVIEASQSFHGVLGLVVDSDGKVFSAAMIQSVNARYDTALLLAARSWKYKPALFNGAPVRYALRMDIDLTPKR